MAELNLGQIKVGKCLSYRDEPHVVTQAQHVKIGRGGAVVKTKLKNLITGSVFEETFKTGNAAFEADLSRSRAQFMYTEGDDYNFMNEENFEQFSLPKEQVGEITDYIIEGQSVDVLEYEGRPVTMSLPPKVELKVVSAPPGIKGDTSGGATNPITLETDLVVNAPLFIKEGDTVRVNTETGEYVERV